MLTRLRFLTAGESHGPQLTAILEGAPAGFPVSAERIGEQLARRQRGFGSGGRQQIERDRVRITAGVTAGISTGGPIALQIENRDFANWRERDVPPMSTPRPGHADLTGAIKYGHRDLRPSLERASARETAARVAVGGVCRQLLGALGVELGGYVRRIGVAAAQLDGEPDDGEYRRRFLAALENDLACPAEEAVSPMREAVAGAIERQDTLGGIFEVVVLGAPPGLGSYAHWDRRLESRLGAAMLGIQAMKGVEIGPAFEGAARYGSEVHDAIYPDEEGGLTRKTNRAGGLEGGITTGAPLVVRVAMKPISTVLRALDSVELTTGKAGPTTYERSDTCAVPRAVPVGEAMVAIVLADALFEKLGGDSLEEMRPRLEALRRGRIEEFTLDDRPWRLDYQS